MVNYRRYPMGVTLPDHEQVGKVSWNPDSVQAAIYMHGFYRHGF
jgi:hypothetical protein